MFNGIWELKETRWGLAVPSSAKVMTSLIYVQVRKLATEAGGYLGLILFSVGYFSRTGSVGDIYAPPPMENELF